jgi:hypothetical protein
MRNNRRWQVACLPVVVAILAGPAAAQQPAPDTSTTAQPSTSPPAKPKAKPKPKPAAATPAPDVAATPPAPKAVPGVAGLKPTLLGQYGEWGAYGATVSGKKVCFALAKPTSTETTPSGRPRNPAYMFITSRPADKVADEISVIIGYPFKPGSEASVDVGSASYALYTQQDGAWIKNATDESKLVDAMRGGDNAVVKGVSVKGTQSTDSYSLRGLSQALDRTERDCK